MATQASTLLLLALCAGLASLASYALSQWRTRRGGGTMALAGVGFGTALLLSAVFLIVMALLLLSHQWLSRLNDTSAEIGDQAARIATPNPFAAIEASSFSPSADEIEETPRGNADVQRTRRPERIEDDTSRAPAMSLSDATTTLASSRPRKTSTIDPALASDPWAATRCVVPIAREWRDGTRWTIVNDCGAVVAVLIATCEPSCVGDRWHYLVDGMLLPAKIQRPTTEAEETQYAKELRHAACVVNDSKAVDLIGTGLQDRGETWQVELEEARSRDGCLNEIRRLSLLGTRSGMPIERLFSGSLYSRTQ